MLWERARHARADVPEEEPSANLEEYVALYHQAKPLRAEAERARRSAGSAKNDATRQRLLKGFRAP